MYSVPVELTFATHRVDEEATSLGGALGAPSAVAATAAVVTVAIRPRKLATGRASINQLTFPDWQRDCHEKQETSLGQDVSKSGAPDNFGDGSQYIWFSSGVGTSQSQKYDELIQSVQNIKKG
eukprot:6474071-Amphidinium_carterae.3